MGELHTERNLIDEQSTGDNLWHREIAHLSGSVNHLIKALVDLVAIGHSKDHFPLEATRDSSEMRWKPGTRGLAAQHEPPTLAGVPVAVIGAHVPAPVACGGKRLQHPAEGHGREFCVPHANGRHFLRWAKTSATQS